MGYIKTSPWFVVGEYPLLILGEDNVDLLLEILMECSVSNQ
jgi:hypothetical protein